jgi:hypothetical protein
VTDQNGSKKGLDQFTKDVLYSALVSVTAKALGWIALLLVALMVALIAAGWDVPAWTLVTMALVAIALVYVARRVTGREAHELRPKLNKAEDELDRHDSYGRNICSVLDTFQKIVAKDIKMSMNDFIEQGILIPGRDVMQENGCPSDLRLSVLIPSNDHFLMGWASGHSVEAKQKYKVPIDHLQGGLREEGHPGLEKCPRGRTRFREEPQGDPRLQVDGLDSDPFRRHHRWRVQRPHRR